VHQTKEQLKLEAVGPVQHWRHRLVPTCLHRQRLAGQVVRFGVVGFLNTAVDFLLLNLLFHVAGLPLLLANTLSYSGGVANSFVWNKHWTFSAGGSKRWRQELVAFMLVSLSALLLNDLGILTLNRLFGGDSFLAINLQKAGASAISMVWNFVGYRFFAFRSHHSEAGV